MEEFITIETLRERVNSNAHDAYFDHMDAMKLALEECKQNGIKVISRKTPRAMKIAVKQLLASPEYELKKEQKIEILNKVISDLLKEK